MFPKISHKLSKKKDTNKADAILVAILQNTMENKITVLFNFEDKLMTYFNEK